MLRVWDMAKLHPTVGSEFLLFLTMSQPKGQVMPHCYHHTAPPPPSSTGNCWQASAHLLLSNVGKSHVALSQKKVIAHEVLGDRCTAVKLPWRIQVSHILLSPASDLSIVPFYPSKFFFQATCSWGLSPGLQDIMLNPSPLFLAPTRLTHCPKSSSRALENLLWQRWNLDQYKDSGKNNNFEGFFALISRSDFDNQLTPLLRAQHQDLWILLYSWGNSTWEQGWYFWRNSFKKFRGWSFRLNLRSVWCVLLEVSLLISSLVVATQTAQPLEICVPGKLAPSQAVSPQAARLGTADFSHLVLEIWAHLEKTLL